MNDLWFYTKSKTQFLRLLEVPAAIYIWQGIQVQEIKLRPTEQSMHLLPNENFSATVTSMY